MTKLHNLLVFRFSSLGDVAMTVPVIHLLLQEHPQLKVTVVSTTFVQPLFEGMDRVAFFAADLKGKHKGVKGLYLLYKDLQSSASFDAVADLHNVLRTKILRIFFSLSGKPIEVINKGRAEKKKLTRKKNKILTPLKPTFERYADVFSALGLPVFLTAKEPVKVSSKTSNVAQQFSSLKQQGIKIVGIAPFAQYAEKTYPPAKMKEVIRMLLQHKDIKILLFGGKAEKEVFKEWEKEFPGIESMAGEMSFREELEIIGQLNLMVSMDSANMHLASLYGVPVVSIWGATHPYAGFYGWGQKPDNAIQIDLYCRPCSVFGNKAGYRGDLACLQSISPLSIYEKILHNLAAESRFN